MKTTDSSIEEDSVVYALTDGIGPILGKEVRRKYYEQKKYLKTNKKFNAKFIDSNGKQFVFDVLALSIFHRTIILPLDGADGFWQLTQNALAPIDFVKMRKNRYSGKDFRRIKVITHSFFSILNKQKIPVDLFAYESMEDFMSSLVSLINRGDHEEE